MKQDRFLACKRRIDAESVTADLPAAKTMVSARRLP